MKLGQELAKSKGTMRSRLALHVLQAATPLLLLGGMSPAMAQTAESNDGASALEEIVVTARRREENLQSTPVAISAFTDAALERQQIFGTDDLDRVTPNLQFTSYGPLTGNNSAAQVFIRGIGQTDGSSGVDPGVGLYIDDVYMGRSVGGVMDFRDTAGVQVLRGPQGTLFGRNTIGGAVLMSTTLPGSEFGGTARVAVGDDNLREAFVAVDLPIADDLGARVSVGARKRDGYVTRVYDGLDLGDEDSYTVQGALHWRSDPLTLTVRGDYSKADENGSPFVFASINERQAFPAAVSVRAGCPGATFPPPSVPTTLVDARCANDATWNLGNFTNGGTAKAASTLENWGVSINAKLDLSTALSLKSITAYRDLQWTGARDADNTPFVILDTDYDTDGDQFSQEFQLLFDAEKLKGVVGAFYFKEDYRDFLQVNFAAPPPLVASGAIPGSRDYQDATIDNKNWALFTQWTFNATDKLSLTGGVRYTEETKGIQIYAITITPNTLPNPNPLPTTVGSAAGNLFVYPDHFEKTFTSTTGSATLQYQWQDNLMTYLSWSQGFKSGGFNQRYNSAPPGNLPIAFEQEEAVTYELGFKSEFGGFVRLNGAVFSTQYDDMQLLYRLGVVPLLFNAGKSSIDGAELEITVAPGALIVEGSVGYLHNKFDEIAVVPGTTATVGPGNTLPFTPEWTANAGVGYDFDVGNFVLTPRVDVSYTGKQFFDAANSMDVAQLEDVTLLNASLSFQQTDKWKVTAGVDNLTDEEYRVAGNSSFTTSAGYGEVIYARPRNWFVRASYEF